jgi:TonB family protein
MADLVNSMNAVFLGPDEPLTDVVPSYWKNWLGVKTGAKVDVVNAGTGNDGAVHRVGGGVSAPRVLYDPDPEYSEMARQAKYTGTVILWLVVDRDGLPKQIRITKPLGMGLDDKAVETVQRWKFGPSLKDGSAVPVMINVEINFKLY